jgi:arabinose-5-phosphate isomerase
MTKSSREDKLKIGLEEAKNALQIEADAVLKLKEELDGSFKKAMELIIDSKGRVVFTGVGKTGLVAKKLAATFSSLGTPAFFVHAGEALHGDLGMITEDDVIMAVSNSGETEEILNLLPSLRRIGAKMVALTGNCSSTLGEYADIWRQFNGAKNTV